MIRLPIKAKEFQVDTMRKELFLVDINPRVLLPDMTVRAFLV